MLPLRQEVIIPHRPVLINGDILDKLKSWLLSYISNVVPWG